MFGISLVVFGLVLWSCGLLCVTGRHNMLGRRGQVEAAVERQTGCCFSSPAGHLTLLSPSQPCFYCLSSQPSAISLLAGM